LVVLLLLLLLLLLFLWWWHGGINYADADVCLSRIPCGLCLLMCVCVCGEGENLSWMDPDY
jgi:hypothetical protein